MRLALLGIGERCRRPWSRVAFAVGVFATITGCAAGTSRPPDLAPHVAAASVGRPPDRGAETSARLAIRSTHAVVRLATRYVGTPYLWGGMSPSGFDCSGFVRYVYARLGILLPRTVRQQYEVGAPVARDRLRPGDIVFFDRLRHNGLYIGDDRLVHASTHGGGVKIASLNEAWFRQRWVGARRPAPGPDARRSASTHSE